MQCQTLRLASYLIAGIFGLGFASQALAQGGPPPGQGQPANNGPFLEDRARRNGEQGLRTVELIAGTDAENQKTVQAAVANVKTDFTRIQVLRNDIARNLVARKPLDYKLVSQQTEEINKRARELKIYMMARVPAGTGLRPIRIYWRLSDSVKAFETSPRV